MSMKSLERAILAEAKKVTKNSKLRMKDIKEWSTGAIEEFPGEVQYLLPELGINISVEKENT